MYGVYLTSQTIHGKTQATFQNTVYKTSLSKIYNIYITFDPLSTAACKAIILYNACKNIVHLWEKNNSYLSDLYATRSLKPPEINIKIPRLQQNCIKTACFLWVFFLSPNFLVLCLTGIRVLSITVTSTFYEKHSFSVMVKRWLQLQ